MQTNTSAPSANTEYTFNEGYPTPQTAQNTYAAADLNRAIEAYKFFYPSVSILATWMGNEAAGVVSNKSFLILQGSLTSWCSPPTLTRLMREPTSICRLVRWWWSCLPDR